MNPSSPKTAPGGSSRRSALIEIVIAAAVIGTLAVPSPAEEPELEKGLKAAISLANEGRNDDSIAILNSLAGRYPGDDRVYLSLGLVLKSAGKPEEAASAFEKAVAIRPSSEGYYSLGLLHEARALSEEKSGNSPLPWLKMAAEAWETLARIDPSDTRKNEVARRHLQGLKTQIEKLSQP